MGKGFKSGSASGLVKNFSVVAYATEAALTASAPTENTVGVVTDKKIPRWYFAAGNPIHDVAKNIMEGATVKSGYISDTGDIKSSNNDMHTDNFIPVEHGKVYHCHCYNSVTAELAVSIVEYDKDQKFMASIVKHEQTATIVNASYTPTSPNVAYIRVNWKQTTATTFIYDVTELDGAVWITYNSAGVSFNAIKKNGLYYRPGTTYQLTSGVWVSKVAKFYQDGKWNDFTGWLYRRGDEFTDITGGWSVGEAASSNHVNEKYYTYMEMNTSTSPRIHTATNTKVDLTGYKTLKVKVSVIANDTSSGLALRIGYSDKRTTSLASATTKTQKMVSKVDTFEVAHDISNVTGSYFVIFGIGFASGTVRLREIWLE